MHMQEKNLLQVLVVMNSEEKYAKYFKPQDVLFDKLNNIERQLDFLLKKISEFQKTLGLE